MTSRVRALSIGLVIVSALASSACQPRAEAMFHIINYSQETVTVGWKSNGGSFLTLDPGEGYPYGVADSDCTNPEPDAILIATSETGKTYTYGPQICKGTSWLIGK
ncbi:hypothetical protein [Microbispora sp. NBRC 16548]|uniref:hypothetical protein n=1 Tax=Microbispora sp. NBRC 16548 TaxID=3030994 RepID=UPI0024A3AAB2|nr:hypothetical protein [Microbispora sp. NBRC 16548]GLX08570.1 hypothetical protein Misp03_54960 [Microbispora sp. NBRC 16548]